MDNNKKLRKPPSFPIPLMLLLSTLSGTTSFAMEGQKEEVPGTPKVGKQMLLSQFATVKEDDLLTTVYPTLLKDQLKRTINNERFLKCDLTDHYAEDLLKILERDGSPNEIYRHLGICKTICEPGAAEATVRNNMPKGVVASPLTTDLYFESVGVKYLGWDDAEMLLVAHKYGVPLRVDPLTKERIPLVLTPEELDRYQTHHEFRVAIHGFYKDYTRLINAQRAKEGLPPIKDYADDYTKHDLSQPIMTFEEKQEMIHKAKMHLQENAKRRERENAERLERQAAEEARKAREKEEKQYVQEHLRLKKEKEALEAERKKNLEEQAKIQKTHEILMEQVRRNEEQENQNLERLRLVVEKIKDAQILKEAEKAQHLFEERKRQEQEKEQHLLEERKRLEAEKAQHLLEERKRLEEEKALLHLKYEESARKNQEKALQLFKDEELARQLDNQLNDDEEYAKALHRQLNG